MKQIYIFIVVIITFSGCFAPKLQPIKVETVDKKINYLSDVKPILDKRCVSCHSCYNSPCQAKFSSYEGIDRGATKIKVYDATRLSAIDPTRLFTDAKNTKQWHEKGFFTLTKSLNMNQKENDSLFLHMLNHKKQNSEIKGTYSPEYDDLTCPKNKEELSEYFEDKPNHGMPYGFPQVKDEEYKILSNWLQQGALGPTKEEQKSITSSSSSALIEIKKWETFLNKTDAKHILTARYLYEHLYLAHLSFKTASNEFYKIVRSRTPFPKPIDLIASVRPFDDPGVKKFYYRIERIHSTIVHKTHLVVEFDDKKLERFKELFIEPKWDEEPHYANYDLIKSANPFLTYSQIPTKSRYQFLLDNSYYIIDTFIRGPVCRGQMALNVIHDHFWVMFKDPKYDISVQNPDFLMQQAENLSLPIEKTSKNIFKLFSDDYRDRAKEFILAKEKLISKRYPDGHDLESIWKGNKSEDSPILTIYRHFNSASVHRGVLGRLPKTMWVIDYPQLERIYYSLVAGYDIFGNVSHQTNIRRYMDFLRGEGELNFISYMPKDIRLDMFKSWYIGDSEVQDLENFDFMDYGNKIKYSTINPKNELIERVVKNHILKSTKIDFDNINYYKYDEKIPLMPKVFNNKEDFKTAVRSLTAKGTAFVKNLVSGGDNNVFVRVILPENKSYVFSIVINRWHDNVNSLFNEESSLNPNKDSMDFIDGYIGSYPNVFAVVNYEDLPEFLDILKNYESNEYYNKKIAKYFISRANPKFWEIFDWFQNDFNKKEPLKSGLYDLNRYNKNVW